MERHLLVARHRQRWRSIQISVWHIDVSYINISGSFYYVRSVLDGYSRFLLNCSLRESTKEADIEIILERGQYRRKASPEWNFRPPEAGDMTVRSNQRVVSECQPNQ